MSSNLSSVHVHTLQHFSLRGPSAWSGKHTHLEHTMFACLLGPNCCELQQQSLVDSRIGEQNMFTHLLMDLLSSWFQEIVCFVFVRSYWLCCGVWSGGPNYIHTCIFSAVYVGTRLSVQFGTKGIQVKQNMQRYSTCTCPLLSKYAYVSMGMKRAPNSTNHQWLCTLHLQFLEYPHANSWMTNVECA